MQMERRRTHSILLVTGAAALLFSLLGAAALTEPSPVGNGRPADVGPLALKAAATVSAAHPSQSMAAAPCANCGVIESIRAAEANGFGRGKRHTVWRVAVRLEDGSLRTMSQTIPPSVAVGDRVRIVDGAAVERA